MGDRRNSGYARKVNDLYCTPAWVTEALLHKVRLPKTIWEPACATGKISRVLESYGRTVMSTDIEPGPGYAIHDFLADAPIDVECVCTNPPFSLADSFISQALRATEARSGMVCMLLPSDFEYPGKRMPLFDDCPQFSLKLALRRRIAWFAGTAEDSGKNPMGTHAWYIWDWRHVGTPGMLFMPYVKPTPKRKARKTAHAQ